MINPGVEVKTFLSGDGMEEKEDMM